MTSPAQTPDLVEALLAEADRRRAAEAKLDAVRAFAADMRTWCSPHDLATHYADQLEAVLNDTN